MSSFVCTGLLDHFLGEELVPIFRTISFWSWVKTCPFGIICPSSAGDKNFSPKEEYVVTICSTIFLPGAAFNVEISRP